MAFNINDIRSQLEFGGARASLFEVSITTPPTIQGGSAATLKIPFLTVRAQVPASTLGTIQVPYFGRKIKLAGDRNFAPWTVTVINDEDFVIRNAMEAWNNAISLYESNVTGLGNSRPLTYKSQAEVIHYGKDGSELRRYKFKGLYPSEVSPITLDWNVQDQLEEFDITFEYDSFEIVAGATGNAGGV